MWGQQRLFHSCCSGVSVILQHCSHLEPFYCEPFKLASFILVRVYIPRTADVLEERKPQP